MNFFKTSFNPIVPIGRALIILFFGTLTWICLCILLFESDSAKDYLAFIGGAAVFGTLCFMSVKALLFTTKTYTISSTSITEYNFLNAKKNVINKEDIKGFSTSKVPYKIWDFKQVLIYLNDGTKLNLMQFAYFNFRKIQPTLMNQGFQYLGDEPYVWKWFDDRVYHYDR